MSQCTHKVTGSDAIRLTAKQSQDMQDMMSASDSYQPISFVHWFRCKGEKFNLIQVLFKLPLYHTSYFHKYFDPYF